MNPIKMYFLRVKWWLAAREPVFCFRCRRIFFLKDTITEYSTTGQAVRLCADCHYDLFHPFGEAK